MDRFSNIAVYKNRLINFVRNNKITVILGVVLLVIVFSISSFLYSRFHQGPVVEQVVTQDLPFDPQGPYALLLPRRDGNAIELNLKRIGSYDSFSYQITYTDSEGIERGAGDLNTWTSTQKKGDYNQEILFGTCSKGNTSDPLHCVFDTGVENGNLVVEYRKGSIAYKSTVPWHIQKPDVALGKLTAIDPHFSYTIANAEKTDVREELSVTAFTIINDLSGLPILPEKQQVLGKVYAVNVATAKTLKAGEVSIELFNTPASTAKIGQYTDKNNSWQMLDTKINGNILTAPGQGDGIYAVLAPTE